MMKSIDDFKVFKTIDIPAWSKILVYILLFFFTISSILLFLVPWVQTSEGYGRVIAYDPIHRTQKISALVSGRIKKWYVTDGSVVKKGDPIVDIVDNDPRFIERLELERDASHKNYEAAKSATETAYIDYKRQRQLFNQGLSSRLKFEKAKITYKKLLADEAKAASKLASSEIKLSRQERQQIQAPQDGMILELMSGSENVLVSEGDTVAVFVPASAKPAVELYIDGNDVPLIKPGREARLMFEGWPAIQFSGWPNVAYGSFEGVVSVVSPANSRNGKFRVIITEAEGHTWPKQTILRQGTLVHGWILLNTVRLGYELWRQFNDFPPVMDDETYRELYPDSNKKKKKNKDK